jgi:DNA/RNA endonuclease YhcR with UshA esterase domain
MSYKIGVPSYPREPKCHWPGLLAKCGSLLGLFAWTNLAGPVQAAVGCDAAAFVLTSGARFAVKATAASVTEIAAINDSLLNTTVEVQATIKSINRPREGSRAPYRVNIADDSGAINLIIWSDVFEVVESQYGLTPGQLISVRARVTEFRGEVQLTLRGAGDLKLLSKAGAKSTSDAGGAAAKSKDQAATALSKIDESMMGQEVSVQANITDVREPRSERAPYIVTLSQDGSQLPLVYWSDIHETIGSQVRVGNVIRAKVQITEHRGNLQLKLRNARDFSVVAGGAAADSGEAEANETAGGSETKSSGGMVKISNIKEDWVNRNVAVSGKIVSSDAIGQGQRLLLRDDTGEIRVILWDNVLSRIPAAEFKSGRTVSVSGRVKVYRGQPEIVPDSADGVQLSSN